MMGLVWASKLFISGIPGKRRLRNCIVGQNMYLTKTVLFILSWGCMKKIVLVAALLLVPVMANAADFPSESKAPASAASESTNWSGFYAGGSAGHASVNASYIDTDGWWNDAGDQYDTDSKSAAAFVNAGRNWQAGQMVFGLEADVGTLNATQTTTPENYENDPESFYKTSIDALGSVRARLGYDFGPALVYVTGGVAFGKINREVSSSLDNVIPANDSGWDSGLALGVGMDYSLDANWTIRAEAIHYDFGSQTVVLERTNNAPSYDHESEVSAVVARIGINYRF